MKITTSEMNVFLSIVDNLASQLYNDLEEADFPDESVTEWLRNVQNYIWDNYE